MADQFLASQTQAAPAPAADYDHIFMAMMETARGRWFLSEYAQRNRNANTELLLAAIARIENAIQPAAPDVKSASHNPERDAAIAKLVGEYGDKTHHLVKALRSATHTIRDATEQLQDLSWDLREQKYDDRLCDTIDGRTREITAVCATLDQATATAHDIAIIIASLDQNAEWIAGLSKAATDAARSGDRPGPRARSLPEAVTPGGGISWKEADVDRGFEAEAAPGISHWDLPEPTRSAAGDDVSLDAELFAPEAANTQAANADATQPDDGIMSLSFKSAVEPKADGPSSNGWFYNFLTRISGENGASHPSEGARQTSRPDAATWSVAALAAPERTEPVFDLPKFADEPSPHARPKKTVRRDAMAPIRAMSEEERIALFS